MSTLIELALRAVLVGVGATLVMDVWALAIRRLGVRSLDLGLLGRWIGHLAHGRWAHARIADATPIRHERLIGWCAHYTIGVAFAGLLLAINGLDWARSPSLGPALAIGLATVVAPLFVLQPALGLGVASSKTPTPAFNALKSVVTHTVFGLGLYLAAAALAPIALP